VTFTDPGSGFSTPDVRDAQEEIVHFNTAGELVWVADGRTLPGYRVRGNTIPADTACACSLVVRFGISHGERRAYFTADYGHDNPGTVVDLEISGDALVVSRTAVFPPGTYRLFGLITEPTDTGQMPVANVGVWVLNEEKTGWRDGKSDSSGFYEIRGLYAGNRDVHILIGGRDTARYVVSMDGDTRFDVQTARR
jgi:hypothetical protein